MTQCEIFHQKTSKRAPNFFVYYHCIFKFQSCEKYYFLWSNKLFNYNPFFSSCLRKNVYDLVTVCLCLVLSALVW